MKNKAVALSIVYSVGQITLGLLLHPYQTMQSLVKDRIFVWMTLLPTLVLALTTIVWRYGVVPGVRLIFSCHTTQFIGCQFLTLASNWLTFFCIYWQVILFYLLVRFTLAFHKRS